MNFPVKTLVISALLLSSACSLWETKPVKVAKPPVQAIVVEGHAAIVKGTRLLARKQAIQDAIRQATLQAGTQVSARTQMSQSSIQTDTATFRAVAAISNTQVLDEWVNDDVYTVRAKVFLSPSDSCSAPFRKRIIATAFPPVDPAQLSSSEAQDIYSGVPREITNQLIESRDFIGRNATQITLYENPVMAPELPADDAYQTSKVMQMAEYEGVQFVLSGVIRDLQIESGDYIRGSGPIGMAKSFLRDVWSRRGIGMDVYVHDGFTGALLLQYRYTDAAQGDVWLPQDYTVGSERFKATVTGEKITQIIAKASSDIRRGLSCYPMATRIVKIEKDNITIDAGAQENLNPGDQLVVYSDVGENIQVEGQTRFVGTDKHPVGVLTLTDVRPRFASGSLEVPPGKAGVRVGDWVRSW